LHIASRRLDPAHKNGRGGSGGYPAGGTVKAVRQKASVLNLTSPTAQRRDQLAEATSSVMLRTAPARWSTPTSRGGA